MARFLILFAVILQVSYIYADVEESIPEIEENENELPLRDILKTKPDENIKDFQTTEMEWTDLFTLPKSANLPTTSSVAKITQVMNDGEKSVEEQCEELKEMAHQITLAIQSEMANLLEYALKEIEVKPVGHDSRKRRSAENPLDCTKLIFRLLNHIKLTNENQNIAIEKMMTAQEIADKFGIEYTPDPDVFADLAIASTKQSEDLSEILKEVYNSKNVSTSDHIEFVPLNNETVEASCHENNTYYVYATETPEKQKQIVEHMNTPPHFEYMPEHIDTCPPKYSVDRIHVEPTYSYYFNIPIETQVQPPPVHHHAPVSHAPKFYEPPMYTPATTDYHHQYYPEPMTTTIILPIEDLFEPEPELVAEEFEETVSSKVLVERGDEPGSATVNHVMTYSVSEKSHFRTPQIEKLPQQVQYYFFLI